MNKRGQEGGNALGTIAAIVIIGVVLAFVFFAFILPEGKLQTIASKVAAFVSKFMPSFDRGLPPPIVETDKAVASDFRNFAADIDKAQEASNAPCFMQVRGITGDMKGFTFQIGSNDEGFFMEMVSSEGAKPERARTNVRFCVVAGEKSGVAVANNFYYNWIGCGAGYDHSCGKTKDDFLDSSPISLSEENLAYGSSGTGREDNGFVYVPEKGKVCFFGAENAMLGNSGEYGLENDIFNDKGDTENYIEYQDLAKCTIETTASAS